MWKKKEKEVAKKKDKVIRMDSKAISYVPQVQRGDKPEDDKYFIIFKTREEANMYASQNNILGASIDLLYRPVNKQISTGVIEKEVQAYKLIWTKKRKG